MRIQIGTGVVRDHTDIRRGLRVGVERDRKLRVDLPGIAERAAQHRDHPPNCSGVPAPLWFSNNELAVEELQPLVGAEHAQLDQALMETSRMRIGPGGFLLPYHHPAELAHRVAMLDHLAQGRLNFGVAASGLPSDWAMFNVDGMSGQHREMTREALEIILRLWSDEPEFDHKGKFWHVTKTGTMLDTLRPHIKPFQKPYPPIGVAGVSKGSDTLKLAGERGFWPMSLNLNPTHVGSHLEALEQGAARNRPTPKRSGLRARAE